MFDVRTYRVLLVIALVAIGFPITGKLAHAQSESVYHPDHFPEGTALFALSACWPTDPPEAIPLYDFSQTLLNAARQKIQQNPSAINRAFFLRHLAVHYSCDHDIGTAVEILDEALVNARQIEDTYWQISRMLSIAIAYHEAFDDTQTAVSVMQEVIAITQTLSEDPAQQAVIYQAIADQYSRLPQTEQRDAFLEQIGSSSEPAISLVEQEVQRLMRSIEDLYAANYSRHRMFLRSEVNAVLSEVETLIRTAPEPLTRQRLQVDLAQFYMGLSNLGAATRLSHPSALSTPDQQPATYHPELAPKWVNLLFELEDYDTALQVARDSGNESDLVGLSGKFLRFEEVGYAWQTFELITQPAYQAQGLAQFAQTYLRQEQPRTAQNLMVRALNIALTVEPDSTMPDWASSRYELITGMLKLYVSDADIESVQALVSLIDDRNTRIAVLLDATRSSYTKTITHPDWPFDNAQNFSLIGLPDDILLKIVAHSATRGHLHQAIEAIAAMRSPEVQITGIMMTQIYADKESATIEDDTLSVLQSILDTLSRQAE